MSQRQLPPADWGRYEPPVTFSDTRQPYEQESAIRPWLEALGLVRRNLWLVGGVTLAALGVVAYRIREAQPSYRATAVVRLLDKTRSVSGDLGAEALRATGGGGPDVILSQVQVLQSRGVAEQVAERASLRLAVLTRGFSVAAFDSILVDAEATRDTIHAQFSAGRIVLRAAGTTVQGRYGERLRIAGASFVVPDRPATDRAELVIIGRDDATEQVRQSLRGRPRERTDAVDVTYEAVDPVLAMRAANAAVEVFQVVNASAAKQESIRRRRFIEEQLAKIELLLGEARTAHNSFRRREVVYSSQDKFRRQQSDLLAIEMRREELDAERRTYASLLDALNSPTGSPNSERLNALAGSPGIASNPIVLQLFSELLRLEARRDSMSTGRWASSPDAPDLQQVGAMIRSVQAKVVAAVRGQIASAEARLGALDELRKRTAGEMATAPGTEAEEAGLLAQVQLYERQADRLRDELQRAQIWEAAEAGQVEIVDLATVPTVPIGTGSLPKIVLALLLGLGIGMGAAYVRENRSSAIRRREDIERWIGAPALGQLPQLRTPAGTTPRWRLLPRFGSADGKALVPSADSRLVVIGDTRSGGAEAFRTLRTNLLFSAAVQRIQKFVITSASPGEGKSTTASNLAAAFALQGYKVLLVDSDLRKPTLQKRFELAPMPGLSNVLLGANSIVEAIRATAVENLSILPAGTIPPNPAELLGSPRMQQLLDGLTQFDMVLIDSPPLLATADAALLARMTDGAVLVVRAGATERRALQEAIQQLSQVHARVIGTVLNDPDAAAAKYASYQSYYHDYHYGYANKA